MSTRAFGVAVSALLLVLPTQYAFAQIDHAHHQEGSAASSIGRVAFETSCSPRAQVEFEKGIALLHSFWYEEATKEFDAASAADPACSMAHWGHAMSLFHQLWNPPDTADRRKALSALESGRKAGSPTPRERAYIEALAAYFDLKPKPPADSVTPDERIQAYRDAMEGVARGFPADDEARIFYALAIYAAAPSGDTTFKDERRADSLLLPLALKYPTHPGVMHYIIHVNDNPALAPLALDAARRYAQLAPAIPHAQHMPSHIFIRLGRWDDVIASNVLATESGTVYEHDEKMDGEWWHNLHTMDFLQYAYLQEGRDRDAQRITDKVWRVEKLSPPSPSLLRYFQAFFATRQLLERGQWREAASLRLSSRADSTSTWSEMVLAFTHALGAARVGNRTLAGVELARLDSLHNYLLQRKDTSGARDAGNLRTAASAWLQLALGNRDEAVRLARQAAANENDASETPLVPAAELEGELLMAVGRPADARQAFERSLRRSPNRARSVFGAASSAAQTGDASAAGRLYGQYIAQMAHGDGSRPELVTAKQFRPTK